MNKIEMTHTQQLATLLIGSTALSLLYCVFFVGGILPGALIGLVWSVGVLGLTKAK